MIKLKLFWIVILATALIIGGCGKKVHNTENGYGFTKFALKIDVSGEEDVKAEYKVKTRKIEAEYINRAHKIKLKGDPAMEELNKIFMEIKLTKNQSQQDVIDKVLKAVDVDNFSKFKLNIDYDDGTKIEFEEEL